MKASVQLLSKLLSSLTMRKKAKLELGADLVGA